MLNTRHVMIGSSICLAIGGVACLFGPAEVSSALGTPSANPIIVQVLGTLYLAAAAANWTARGAMIGGIYARPLSIGNFVHFVVGSIVLLKSLRTDALNVTYACVVVVYVVFAVMFVLLLYGRLGSAPARESIPK
jgi:hypothetical protein